MRRGALQKRFRVMTGHEPPVERPKRRAYLRQWSVTVGQRVENTQPTGGLNGEGGSPVRTTRSRRGALMSGVLARSARV